MDKKKKLLNLFKKIAAVAFAVSFLMALVLFAHVGTDYISPLRAKYVFIGSGAVALFFNLLSFESGKHNPIFSFIYWISSIVVFTGLVFLILRWPHAIKILVGGLVMLGASFFISPNIKPRANRSDLLDN